MEKSKKEKRNRKLHSFIIECLKKRPLSSSQMLKKIQDKKNKEGESIFAINTLIGLRKDHLKFLEENKVVFRLAKDEGVPYMDEKMESEEFMNEFWQGWEKGAEKNYYHAYYFYTPTTSKIYPIFERILDKFQKYFKNEKDILKELNFFFFLLAHYDIFINLKNDALFRYASKHGGHVKILEIVRKGKPKFITKDELEIKKDYKESEELILNKILLPPRQNQKGFSFKQRRLISPILINLVLHIRKSLHDIFILLGKNLNLNNIMVEETRFLNKNSKN